MLFFQTPPFSLLSTRHVCKPKVSSPFNGDKAHQGEFSAENRGMQRIEWIFALKHSSLAMGHILPLQSKEPNHARQSDGRLRKSGSYEPLLTGQQVPTQVIRLYVDQIKCFHD